MMTWFWGAGRRIHPWRYWWASKRKFSTCRSQSSYPQMEKLNHKSSTGKPKVVIIVGPTAVGKTSISLDLATRMRCEIISADSVQAYKGLDIGSDKVSAEVQNAVPHHGIDIGRLSDFRLSVEDFLDLAYAAIDDIISRGLVPVIVGGSHFYIESLIEGKPKAPGSNPESQAVVKKQMAERGNLAANHAFLCEIDPEYGAAVEPGDWKKIERALIIYYMSNRPPSTFPRLFGPNELDESPYDFRAVMLYRPRLNFGEVLVERCEQIVHAGLVEETYWAILNGLLAGSDVQKAIGYRQAHQYLRDCWFADTAPTEPKARVENFRRFLDEYKHATRALAVTQMKTFLRNNDKFLWLDTDLFGERGVVDNIINLYNQTAPSVFATPVRSELRLGRNWISKESPVFWDDSRVIEKLESIDAYLAREPWDLPHPLSIS